MVTSKTAEKEKSCWQHWRWISQLLYTEEGTNRFLKVLARSNMVAAEGTEMIGTRQVCVLVGISVGTQHGADIAGLEVIVSR
jgi:hypothetical protein